MDIRRRISFNMNTGGGQPSEPSTSGTYTVNLNGQWEKTTDISNPDSTLYDGVYRSSSNYNVNSGVSIMYITIKDYSSFKLYIRSYAESTFDYVMVSQLDKTITGSTSYSDTTLVKAHTRGNQQSGTALSSYTLVEFTGISSGEHTITVVYRKDSSVNNGDDRGYVLIPKNQENSDNEGDIEIDTTYSIRYTSNNGAIVTPYSTSVFGANVVSNNYIDGQGIISFDGPVTTIGGYAFKGCVGLKSVTIPDSVKTIGDSAFLNCSNLISATIPNSVTTIGYSTFNSCESLTSISIPDSVTSIGEMAFGYCDNLTSIIIPNSVTTIEENTFNGCKSLASVTIPTSVTTIGEGAFYECKSLTSITIPSSIRTIEKLAFSECVGLTSITIPDSVTTIGEGAFRYCDNLTSVTIPNSVKTIGEGAFGGCYNLKEFKGGSAFINGRCLIINGKLVAFAPAGITEFTIPDSVTSIGGYAFCNCYNLTNITITNNVTTIGVYAFYYCNILESITIPNSVTTIGKYAFSYCGRLNSVTIPNSVTTIGDRVFYDCDSITSVYCKAATPPTLGGTFVFDKNHSGRKIYVPAESVDAYKSATRWSEYADAIVGYDFE